jgi:copper chaperone CopZ
MKRRLLIMLAGVGILLSGASCRQHDYRTLTIEVPEMRNDACVRVVGKSLSRTPGLQPKSFKADIEGRTVTITYDSLLVADKNIEFKIARAGFEANGIPADAKAAAKLPPDCRR